MEWIEPLPATTHMGRVESMPPLVACVRRRGRARSAPSKRRNPAFLGSEEDGDDIDASEEEARTRDEEMRRK